MFFEFVFDTNEIKERNCKMKSIYGILLASLSAAAADAVYNGGFEAEAKKGPAAMVRNMKNKNWQKYIWKMPKIKIKFF